MGQAKEADRYMSIASLGDGDFRIVGTYHTDDEAVEGYKSWAIEHDFISVTGHVWAIDLKPVFDVDPPKKPS